ncbi:MAG: hypothetical protein EXQ87_02505 [Alphaproteobacteria bacterium]|nr:hypothetical protein [Alphaproteobacteria bacterium]
MSGVTAIFDGTLIDWIKAKWRARRSDSEFLSEGYDVDTLISMASSTDDNSRDSGDSSSSDSDSTDSDSTD